MDETMKFDYYYGVEAEQFSFYRVPRLLIKDERFKDLSSDAKMLYGLMLDRMSLSMKNGWIDDQNRAYIYYTLDNIMEDLGCAREKCAKVIAELDDKKGIGLIQKKRQGLGKPDIIYVMNFATIASENSAETASNSDASAEVRKANFKESENRISRSSEIELQEVRKSNFKEFGNQTSRSSETKLQEVRKPNSNYNNTNQTEESYTDHVSQSDPAPRGGELVPFKGNDMMDMNEAAGAYMEIIRENIEYDFHMKYDRGQDKELFEEMYELICDVVCVPRKTIRVDKEDYPYELVKSRFLKLRGEHLEYVRGRMKETTSKITNIRSYLITVLYNAPSTINHFYQQDVQHDLYGS